MCNFVVVYTQITGYIRYFNDIEYMEKVELDILINQEEERRNITDKNVSKYFNLDYNYNSEYIDNHTQDISITQNSLKKITYDISSYMEKIFPEEKKKQIEEEKKLEIKKTLPPEKVKNKLVFGMYLFFFLFAVGFHSVGYQHMMEI